MRHFLLSLFLFFGAIPLAAQQGEFNVETYKQFLESYQNLTASQIISMYPAGEFKGNAPGNTAEALYLDSAAIKLELTEYEVGLVNEHGFMVTERNSASNLSAIYEDIYYKDLPLFISTDVILHAMHVAYRQIMVDIEGSTLIGELQALIRSLHSELPALYATYGAADSLALPLEDYEFYILTAAELLMPGELTAHSEAAGERVAALIEHIESEQVREVSFFGEERHAYDFSQFKVRGHYADPEYLETYPLLDDYFKAMIWLGRTEINLLPPVKPGYDEEKPSPRSNALAALLVEGLLAGDGITHYTRMNDIIGFLTGGQDNVTPVKMSELLVQTGMQNPEHMFDQQAFEAYTATLAETPGLQQRITSQIIANDPMAPGNVKPAIAFMLLGQRFILDSYITDKVVYDDIEFNGEKIRRMLPSSLDVLAGLGNNAALQLLEPELEEYKYGTNLASLRYLVESYDDDFWQESLFSYWLQAIRLLNPPEQRETLPDFMQTGAWWQQKINTQLSSWSQLRHDNILYAKQSYTDPIGCGYPFIYVEPFPEFYQWLSSYADRLKELDAIMAAAGSEMNLLDYAERFGGVCDSLAMVAEKELSGETLTEDELTFLAGVRLPTGICGAPPTGWMLDILYDPLQFDKADYLVADVHTSATDEGGNVVGWVLHTGTGDFNYGIVTAANHEGKLTAFAGAFLSHYEYTSSQFLRLNDQEWEDTYRFLATRPDYVNTYLADLNGEARHEGRALITSVKDGGGSPAVPATHLAAANYPNPFNPVTNISVTIPSDGLGNDTAIRIYDITGSLVKELYNGRLPAGTHVVQWDARNEKGAFVPSGVYLYRVTNGPNTVSGKMTLLK